MKYPSCSSRAINGPRVARVSTDGATALPHGFRLAWVVAAGTLALLASSNTGFGAQPSALKITRVARSGGNVVVNWEGGRSPYQLLCRTNLNGEWHKVGPSTSAYQVTNPAMPGPSCFYRITTDLSAPSTPNGLVISTNSFDTQLVLRWNAATDNSGGAGLKGYNIYRNNVFVKRVLPTATTTIDTGLNPDTAYSYSVSAEDLVANESAKSSTVSGRTPRRNDSLAPSVPAGLTAAVASCNVINLSWGASTDTGSGVKGYNVYRGGAFVAQVLAPTTSYSDTGRAALATYSYTVSALDNANNQSAQSGASSAATPACPDLVPPSVPTALTATASSCSQINLTWVASADTGGSGLKGYNIYRGGAFVAQVLAPSTYYSDTGRTALTTHSYTVQAVDNANNPSAQSAAASASTPSCPDSSAPSVPTGFSAASGGTNRINLSWNASVDTGGSGLAGYKVWRGSTYLGVTTATTYSDSGLAAGTTYCYSVAAYDYAGNNSAQTAQACATTATATQACTYSLSPASANPGAAAGSGSFTVTAGAGCSWTPASSAPSWLTCSPANGSGSGAVTWYVTANTSTSPRSGTLSIQGQTFTVTQAGTTTTGTSGQLQWVRQHSSGVNGNGYAMGLAVDRFGNTISVGAFCGTVDFGTVPLSTSGASDTDGFIVKYDAQGRAMWARRLGSSLGADGAVGVTVDSQGNIIVIGSFVRDVNFGGTILSTGGSGNPDIFVVKYDTANPPNLIWAKRLGGTEVDSVTAVAVDANNDVFVGALIASINADFGGVTLNTTGIDDVAIAKLSAATGSTLWAKRWGGATTRERIGGLAVDRSSGDVWATGSFTGTTDLGSGPVSASPANWKIFLARYSGADGSYRTGSLKTMGTSGSNGGKGVAVDPGTGNVIITGGCVGAVDFGGGPVLNNGSTVGSAFFVAAYGPSGNYLWARELGDGSSTGNAYGSSVAIDESGNIAITGQSVNPFYTGTQWLVGGGCFIVTFDRSGAFQWGRLAGEGSSQGAGVAFDSLGHVVTAGYAVGPVNFGPGPTGQPIYSTAPYGVNASFVAQYLK